MFAPVAGRPADGEGDLFKRSVLVLASALLTGGVTYALAAANVIPATNAGQGAGSIVGYTISNASYTLDVTNPQSVTAARFTLNAPPAEASTVRAKVGSASYAVCALAGSTATTSTWTCPLTGVTTSMSPTLRVAAAQ